MSIRTIIPECRHCGEPVEYFGQICHACDPEMPIVEESEYEYEIFHAECGRHHFVSTTPATCSVTGETFQVRA